MLKFKKKYHIFRVAFESDIRAPCIKIENLKKLKSSDPSKSQYVGSDVLKNAKKNYLCSSFVI